MTRRLVDPETGEIFDIADPSEGDPPDPPPGGLPVLWVDPHGSPREEETRQATATSGRCRGWVSQPRPNDRDSFSGDGGASWRPTSADAAAPPTSSPSRGFLRSPIVTAVVAWVLLLAVVTIGLALIGVPTGSVRVALTVSAVAVLTLVWVDLVSPRFGSDPTELYYGRTPRGRVAYVGIGDAEARWRSHTDHNSGEFKPGLDPDGFSVVRVLPRAAAVRSEARRIRAWARVGPVLNQQHAGRSARRWWDWVWVWWFVWVEPGWRPPARNLPVVTQR